MRTLEDLEKYVNEAISKHEQEIADIERTISEQKKVKAEAEQAIQKTPYTNDLDEFTILRQQIREAEDNIDFYSARLKVFTNKKNVGEADTQKLDADLIALQGKSNDDFEKEIMPVVDDLRKIVNKYRTLNFKINDTMNKWHNHVSGTFSPEVKKSWLFNRLDMDMRKFDNALKYRPN